MKYRIKFTKTWKIDQIRKFLIDEWFEEYDECWVNGYMYVGINVFWSCSKCISNKWSLITFNRFKKKYLKFKNK